MPRALWWSYGGGRFLMSEVPLYSANSGVDYAPGREAGTGPPRASLGIQGLLKTKDTHRRRVLR